jgi:hypothetical protein
MGLENHMTLNTCNLVPHRAGRTEVKTSFAVFSVLCRIWNNKKCELLIVKDMEVEVSYFKKSPQCLLGTTKETYQCQEPIQRPPE